MYILFLLFVIISVAYTTPVVLVLGSHIPEILQDRMETAIKYIGDKEVIWYLSGGINNQLEESEGSMMSQYINSQYVVTDTAKNTAENFAYFRKWLDNHEVDGVIIVTSKWHYNRAKKIIEGIIPSVDFIWILGNASCKYCKSDEFIHMKNVPNDIQKALDIYKN